MERLGGEAQRGECKGEGEMARPGLSGQVESPQEKCEEKPRDAGNGGDKRQKGKCLQVYLSPIPGKKPVTKATGPIFLAHTSHPLNEP